jgi:shikimate kinase
MMGSGKTSIGRRLARRLGLPFVDADDEIVKAAGCSIEDIFARYGEQAFRDGERRVIGRLLDGGAQVLATGGGAFMDPATRARIRTSAVSIWLRANLDILVERTGRHGGRPLLERCDRRETLTRLMNERHPVYAEADIVIDTTDESHDVTVERAVAALAERGHLIALRSEARL